MNGDADVTAADRWVAAVRSEEVPDLHVAVARLHDADIALWRDTSGRINAWENRCPHRGMRLTLGTNTGQSLVCRYHGWRFASGSGACHFIPAHPRQTPPIAAAVRTYPSYEKYGFVWVGFGEVTGEPQIPGITGNPYLTFRSLTFDAPFAAVRAALLRETGAVVSGELAVRAHVTLDGLALPAVYLAAPRSADSTVVHGFAAADVGETARLPLMRLQNERLKALRGALERERFASLSTP